MRATDLLRHDHRDISFVLTAMSRMAGAIGAGKPFDPAPAERAVDILRTFVDRCHHVKEERHLFEVLAPRCAPSEQRAVAVLAEEHGDGRNLIQGMLAALPAASTGDVHAARTFAANARDYVRLMRQHITKEQQTAFELADRLLSAEDDRRLVEAFAAVEREALGEGGHERYERWAHELVPRPRASRRD